MENNDNRHNNNFGTAFFLGILIGVGIALLFTTKKGRKLLRTFSEEGFDNIPDLKKYFRSPVDEFSEDDDEDASGSEYVEEKIRVAEMPRPHTTRIHVDEEPERRPEQKEHHAAPKKSSPVRRFFRGTPKKS